LTALLKSLNPDVDIENLLENGLPADRQPATKPSPRSPQQIDEASPGSSHDYEWHEAPLSSDEVVHSLQDGMALLSTEPSGSGYLGKSFLKGYIPEADTQIGSSAGSSMLQTICSLLSLKGPLDEPSKNEISKLIATRKRQRSDSGVLLLEGQLASSAITDGLIDAYFLLYNTSYPVLHSQLFRDDYANRSEIPNTSTWQLVFYTVLAIGHWVLSSGEDHADSPYYLAARSRMSAGMLESGTLTGVQAFLLMVFSLYALIHVLLMHEIGKLFTEERSTKHWLQYDWYSFQNGAGSGLAS
jgi:transcriptional regulatory protein GAL4